MEKLSKRRTPCLASTSLPPRGVQPEPQFPYLNHPLPLHGHAIDYVTCD